jgi:hypothetical protein
LINITELVEKFFLRFSLGYARVGSNVFKHTPKQILFKTKRPMLPPQQRRATHLQMAQHTLTGVWAKPALILPIPGANIIPFSIEQTRAIKREQTSDEK